MSSRLVLAGAFILTLAALWSVMLGGTVSAWVDTTTTATNTFTASAAPGVPLGVVVAAGDGQIGVNWSAPSSNGGSSITGYTAVASPSAATCTSTSATACTITGLTDGNTQSVTVTASNAVGTGTASAAQSATPYPATLFTGANGLSLWLDAADSGTLFSSSSCSGAVSAGASIGCWSDKGATGENFTQATAGSQPVLGSLNGLGAINFTNVAQVLNSINGSDTYQTVFIATQPQTTSGGWDSIFGQAGSDFSVRTSTAGGQFSSPNSNDWAGGTGTPPLDWSNGRQATAPTLGSTSILTAQSSGPQKFSASVSSTFLGRGMLGNVGEVIAFPGTLTTAQRRTVEDYLSRKWGVTITPDPPGTPAATVGTAGTASAAVSWTAPAYNGGSSVTGYTVTSNPGAQTCTTTAATGCTVTGLTTGTAYTFTVTAANSVGTSAGTPASNQITPATAPVTSAAAVGRSGAYDTGFIAQASSYYVYANVADTGNPASAIASVTADVHTIKAGSTAVVLSSGSFTAGGTAYNYRSGLLTAATPLTAGSDPYTVTATDSAGSTATQNFTTVIDNTAPTATDVQSTNVSGGTVGHLDQGDTLKLTYSSAMDPYSILAGWTGATTNVQVALVDGGGSSPDSIYVYNTAASPNQIPVGIVTLGSGRYLSTGTGNYIVFGPTGSGTASTMTRNGAVITIVLGTPNGSSLTNTSAGAMAWAPTTSATDIAGNAVTAAAATQSGAVHVNF